MTHDSADLKTTYPGQAITENRPSLTPSLSYHIVYCLRPISLLGGRRIVSNDYYTFYLTNPTTKGK